MRAILGMGLLFAVFSAYWFALAQTIRNAPEHLDPFGLHMSSVAVSGYPARFDLRLTDPAAPRHGWSAQWVQAQARSYWPFAVEGKLSGAQSWRLAGADWQTDGAEMPFTLQTDPSLQVQSAQVQAGATRIDGPLAASFAGFTLRLDPATDPAARRVTATLRDLSVPALDSALVQASVNAVLTFDTVPDLRGMARWNHMAIQDLTASWEDVALQASGDLARGADGRLDGQIQLSIRNWRDMLAALMAAGYLPPDQAPMIGMMAQSMADGADLTLPLAVNGSILRLGPLALLDLGQF
jgi:hypothetical protein